MRYGVTMFATDVSMDVPSLAVAAEERGFDSVWIPEHTHIPRSRRTPPPTGDETLPEEYRRSVDPLVALAAAAAVTSRIHLGTGVMLPAQREPIVTAKAIATLANLSSGRFELGVGFGWNVDEMEHHGVEYRHRREVAREHMLAMQALWRDEDAEFHGEHVDFAPSWSWPKPDQHIPALIGGGAGPKMFAHLAEYADGWIPIGGAGLTEAIPRYLEALEEAGRDPRRGADCAVRVASERPEARALRFDRCHRVRVQTSLRPGGACSEGARRTGRTPPGRTVSPAHRGRRKGPQHRGRNTGAAPQGTHATVRDPERGFTEPSPPRHPPRHPVVATPSPSRRCHPGIIGERARHCGGGARSSRHTIRPTSMWPAPMWSTPTWPRHDQDDPGA